ncbi:hypothetical protein LUZ60_017544 [Juncus effusus]|nr:hypothetical protein LUZ60_017544 [Juncus effusus]
MGLTGLRSGSEKKESKSFKRKIDKKVSFYNKVKDSVVSLGAKKSLNKKKRLKKKKKLKAYDLSVLSEFLPDLETLTKKSAQQTELKINCKSRQTLVQKEAARMQAVLNDPSFIKDPFEAIHEHLLKSQLPIQEENKGSSKSSSKEKKKEKKRRKKAKSAPQEMEI